MADTAPELAVYVEGLQRRVLDDDKVDRLSDLMAELEGLYGEGASLGFRVCREVCGAADIERRPRGARFLPHCKTQDMR